MLPFGCLLLLRLAQCREGVEVIMKSIEAVVWEIADKYLPSLGVKSFADLFALTNPSSLRFAPRLLPLMDWIDSFEQLAYSSGSHAPA